MIKKPIRLIASFFLIASTFACKTRSLNSATKELLSTSTDSIFASIERAPCFGKCPAYAAVILKTGNVTYEGHSSVPRIGMFQGKASVEQMKKLTEAAKEMHLDTLKNEYMNPHLVDFPLHNFSIFFEGRRKEIKVADNEVPVNIDRFEKIFDKVLEEIRWRKVENKP